MRGHEASEDVMRLHKVPKHQYPSLLILPFPELLDTWVQVKFDLLDPEKHTQDLS